MTRCWKPLLATMLVAGTAHAQDAERELRLSAGLRLWNTQWTTFTGDDALPNAVLQSAARDKLVLMPSISLRYGDWLASYSRFQSARFRTTRDSGRREESDLNLGYQLTPGVIVTLGYKWVLQSGDSGEYKPHGPVLGVNANAALGQGFGLYGTLGFGKFNSPAPIKFEADYRLLEAGVAYSLPVEVGLKSLSLTAGYRMQVLNSLKAKPNQDGRDLTHGLTVGLLGAF
jgi:hypothetical protein